MKKKLIVLSLAVTFSAVMAASAFAATSVIYTRHNLGTTHNTNSAPGVNYLTGSDDTPNVCVFCHTPHGAKSFGTDLSANQVAAPIWNKNVNTGAYTMYTISPTLDSIPQTSGPTGVSLACLSCHDGTMAMDTMLNAPGSGWRNNGTSRGLTTTGATYTWSGAAATGLMPPSSVPNLGTDLSNDHPISMKYAGSINADSARDRKFKNASTVSTASNKKVAVVFPRQGNIAGSNPSDGDIRLFDLADGRGFEVQCASCHNPHGTDCGGAGPGNADTDDCEGATGAYYTFLQRSNKASQLCLACHDK